MLREHVAAVCRRYGARIHSYDVVNECVDNLTGEMRETAFSRAMGGAEPVVDAAFHAAREAAPGAQLVYNDYMTWTTVSAPHRSGVLRLLEGFRRRGVPVDALGVQAHLGARTIEGQPTDPGPLQEREWRDFLDEVVAMGFDLLITEFDVNDRNHPADAAVRDRQVADHARAYLDLMLSYPRVGDILAWGMSDGYSWLQNNTRRPDGLAKRPCPYDADFRPKPLRAAIAQSLREAVPHRAAEAAQ
jgi:endo-1,4-beta-xylanase